MGTIGHGMTATCQIESPSMPSSTAIDRPAANEGRISWWWATLRSGATKWVLSRDDNRLMMMRNRVFFHGAIDPSTRHARSAIRDLYAKCSTGLSRCRRDGGLRSGDRRRDGDDDRSASISEQGGQGSGQRIGNPPVAAASARAALQHPRAHRARHLLLRVVSRLPCACSGRSQGSWC